MTDAPLETAGSDRLAYLMEHSVTSRELREVAEALKRDTLLWETGEHPMQKLVRIQRERIEQLELAAARARIAELEK